MENQRPYHVSDYAYDLLSLLLAMVYQSFLLRLRFNGSCCRKYTTAPGKRFATQTTIAIKQLLRGLNLAALILQFEDDLSDSIALGDQSSIKNHEYKP